MCLTDSKGRILKENFFPISASSLRGSYEILVRRNTGGGSYDKFVRSLDGLEQGDEIAFKGGPYRLNYEGTDDPIKFVTVVSAGVGIAPSIQILNGIPLGLCIMVTLQQNFLVQSGIWCTALRIDSHAAEACIRSSHLI